MPIAKFKSIFLCSSEDKNYPATNLVNNSNKKWKCEESGLDSVYVILQFEQPLRISGIDIGNESSAFIEVSVGRTGWPAEKFKTILVSSSFMTITESRVSENPNRVRCFGKDALMPISEEKWEFIKVQCTQGFNKHVQFGLSFIKITTPDNIVASVPKPTVSESPKEKKSCDEALGLSKNSVFAKFRMRVDSTDSDKDAETSSSLFSKWKEEKNSPQKDSLNISAAAAIREASSSMAKLEESTKINRKIETPSGKSRNSIDREGTETKKERVDRYRAAILYDDEDDNTSKPRLEKLINQDKERIERERKEQMDKKKGKNNTPREEKSKKKMDNSAGKFKLFLDADVPSKLDDEKSVKVQDDDDDDIIEVKKHSPEKVVASTSVSTRENSPEPQTSREKSPNPSTPPAWKVKKRPSTAGEESAKKRSKRTPSPEPDDIHDLLKGVVFVISGIQNPDRSDMRGKGLEMGAKYKPDWDDSCTHLICAFKNTPKYKQVHGSGIIVNKKWINDCYTQKKKLPWQDYKV